MAMLRSKMELRLCESERCPLADYGIAGTAGAHPKEVSVHPIALDPRDVRCPLRRCAFGCDRRKPHTDISMLPTVRVPAVRIGCKALL
jgi:hypothetical protein